MQHYNNRKKMNKLINNRKKMNKLIASIFTLFAISSSAETLVVTSHYAAGGPGDNIITAMTPSLARHGLTVEKVFFKTCAEALRSVTMRPNNNIMFITSGDINFKSLATGSRCPPLSSLNQQITIYSGVYEIPVVLLSVPGSTLTSYAKIKEASSAGKKLKVGYVVTPVMESLAKELVREYPELSLVALPYDSGASLKLAAIAKDIDLVINSGIIADLQSRGGVAVATSVKNTNIPFMGNMKPQTTEIPEVISAGILVSVPNMISPTANSAMVDALSSSELASLIQAMGATNSGIGSGIQPAVTLQREIDTQSIIKK
jgi:hypothetical protein